MLHDITSGKDNNIVFKRKNMNLVDLNEKRRREKKGWGSQILAGCMQKGGGDSHVYRVQQGGWGV